MRPHRRSEKEDMPGDQLLEMAFEHFVEQAQASPEFAARVRTRVAALETEREPRPRRWTWLRLETPAWALAMGLVLSLALNVWLGFQDEVRPTRGGIMMREKSAMIKQGDRYAAQGEDAQAVQIYEAIVEAEGAPLAPVLRKAALLHNRLGQYAQAIAAATAAVVLNPQEAVAYRARGIAYHRLGDSARAIPDVKQAARLGDTESKDVLRAWNVTP